MKCGLDSATHGIPVLQTKNKWILIV